MEADTILITRYIAAWFWHTIGVMFFIQAIRFLIVKDYQWMIAMMFVTGICEIFAFLRQRDVYDEKRQYDE